MEITTVHYQKLTNLGDDENERIGAWANVGEDETPEEALAQLTAWVEDQGKQRGESKDELEETRRLIAERQDTLRSMNREVKQMAEIWSKARAFLEKVGLELPRSSIAEDDIPF